MIVYEHDSTSTPGAILYNGHPLAPKQARCRQVEVDYLTERDEGTFIVEGNLDTESTRETKERRLDWSGRESTNGAFWH